MKNTSDFRTDLDYGEEAEKMLDGYLKHGQIEVKRDRLMHRTGRVYIEYISRQRPSGIAMDDIRPVWMYCVDDMSFGLFMDANRLREAIKRFKKECEDGLIDEPCHWAKLGGDEDTSQGALIAVEDLARIMLEIAKEKSR